MDGKAPAPAKKLKLVKLRGPLGDFSGMSAAERAELVAQDGQRRIFEEMTKEESRRLRNFLRWGGSATVALVLAIGLSLFADFIGGNDILEDCAMVVVGLSVVFLSIAPYFVVYWLAKWISAIVRRRRGMSFTQSTYK